MRLEDDDRKCDLPDCACHRMSNTKDIKAEIVEVITRIRRKGIVMDGDIDQAAQEILEVLKKKLLAEPISEYVKSEIEARLKALGLKGE